MPRVLLVGASGRLPHNGHLRVRLGSGPVRGEVAARISAHRPPPEAWDDVRALAGALQGLEADTPEELIDAVRTQAMAAADDCAVLVTAWDDARALWWAHGLDAVQMDGAPQELLAEPAPWTAQVVGLAAGDVPPPGWS